MFDILNLLNSGSKLVPDITGGAKAASGDNPAGFMAYLTAVMGQIESEEGAAGNGKNILTGQKTPNSQPNKTAGENFLHSANFTQAPTPPTDKEKAQGLDFLMALLGIPQEEQESLLEAFNNINTQEAEGADSADAINAIKNTGENGAAAKGDTNAHAPDVKNTYFYGSSRIPEYGGTTEDIFTTEIYMQHLKGIMKATERIMAMIKPKDELDEEEEANLAVEELTAADGENTLFQEDVDRLVSVMPGKEQAAAAVTPEGSAKATAAFADELKQAVKAEAAGKSSYAAVTEDVVVKEASAEKIAQSAEKAVSEKTAKEALKVDEIEISSLKEENKKTEHINERRVDVPKADQTKTAAASVEQLKADQAKADSANKLIDAENKAAPSEPKPAEEKADPRQYAAKPAENETRQAEARPVRAEAKDVEVKQAETRSAQSDKANQTEGEPVEATEAEMDAGADKEGKLADNKGDKGGKDTPDNKFAAVMKEKGSANTSQTQTQAARNASEAPHTHNSFTERADTKPAAENVQQHQAARAEEKILQWQSIRDAANLAKMIQQAGQNGVNKLTVRLNPEHLGRLEIQLTEAGGRMNARILASSPESRALLASAGDAIRQQLQEKGIHIDNMDFNFADSAAKEHNAHDQGRGASERRQHLGGSNRNGSQEDEQADEIRSPVKEGIYA